MKTCTKQRASTIKASVAVEKVWLTQHSYTFRSEIVEVEPVVIMRRTCGSHGAGLSRFYYDALVKPPAVLAPEYSGLQEYGQEPNRKRLLRVCISRRLNPTWKPPLFDEGKHVADLADERAPTQKAAPQHSSESAGGGNG